MNKTNRRLLAIVGIAVVIVFVALDWLRGTKAESTAEAVLFDVILMSITAYWMSTLPGSDRRRRQLAH